MKGFGKMVYVKIVDQFNSHDVLFEGRARINYPEELEDLFRNAQKKGFPDFPMSDEELNRDFLFGKREEPKIEKHGGSVRGRP